MTAIYGADLVSKGADLDFKLFFLKFVGGAVVDPGDEREVDRALSGETIELNSEALAEVASHKGWLSWLLDKELGIEPTDLIPLLRNPDAAVRWSAVLALAPHAGVPEIRITGMEVEIKLLRRPK